MITPERASVIAHGDLRYFNPISPETFERVIGMLPLEQNERVLDVGCGRGELLLEIVKRTGAAGLGIDLGAEQIALAVEVARHADVNVRFERLDATQLDEPDGSFQVAACVGSTHALGGLAGTLERLSALVRPGGYLLIGEGFWAQPPTAAFLEALGSASEDELTGFPELLAAGDRHDLTLTYVATASTQDWERYEWSYIFNADGYAQQHPNDKGVELLHERADAGRERRRLAAAEGETLGFALLLWRRCVQGATTPRS